MPRVVFELLDEPRNWVHDPFRGSFRFRASFLNRSRSPMSLRLPVRCASVLAASISMALVASVVGAWGGAVAAPREPVPMPGQDGGGRPPPPISRDEVVRPPTPRDPGDGAAAKKDPGAEVDRAFAELAEAPDDASAAPARSRLLLHWALSGSASADILVARAEEAAAGGDAALASDLYDAAIVAAPNFVAARHERGVLHLLRQETSAAIDDFRSTLQLDPRHFPSLSLLSAVMESLDRKREALDLLRRAVALDPNGEGYKERLERLTVEVEGRQL